MNQENVSRENLKHSCTKCRKEPRRPGQRWGNKCFKKYQRKWDKKNTKYARALRDLISKHAKRRAA